MDMVDHTQTAAPVRPLPALGALRLPGLLLAHALQAAILVIGLLEIHKGELWWGPESLLFVLVISAPYLLGRVFGLVFPWPLTVMVALSMFMHCIGNYLGYYWSLYPFYDKLVHFVASAMVATVALVGIGLFERQPHDSIRAENENVPIVLLLAALIMGVLWEVVEFVFDITLGTTIFTLQHGAWDTALDMVADFLGGAVVAAYAVAYLKYNRKKDLVRDRPEARRG